MTKPQPLQKLILFKEQSIDPESGVPSRITDGKPQTRTWNHTTDLNETLFTGVWEATVGTWQVYYDEWEYCHILSGKAIITDAAGNTRTVAQGDCFVIEPGFSGSWEVLETLSKGYVILLMPDSPTTG